MSEYVVVAATAAFIEHLWLHVETKLHKKSINENKIKIKKNIKADVGIEEGENGQTTTKIGRKK